MPYQSRRRYIVRHVGSTKNTQTPPPQTSSLQRKKPLSLLGGKGGSVDHVVYTQDHPDDLSREQELLTFRDERVVYVLLLHVYRWRSIDGSA
jgi:hypothetical protein